MSRERLAAIALVGVAMTLAFVWFWPTLHVGLRSDDYLIVYYYDRTTGALHWGRMLEEFVRPWFGAAELYRPMVSTSFAVDILLWPSPLGFNFQNVMITAVAVAAIALTARRLLPTRSAISWIAALAGAVLLLLHPATVEPTAWIAGRTNSLELAFGALASWLFLRHLDGACGRAPMLVAFVLALCSKESAAALPLTFVISICCTGNCATAPARGAHGCGCTLRRSWCWRSIWFGVCCCLVRSARCPTTRRCSSASTTCPSVWRN